MKRSNKMVALFAGMFFLLFAGCKKEVPHISYTQKADKLLKQVLSDAPCDCLIEIHDATPIDIANQDRPSYDMRGELMQKLKLDGAGLDSMIGLSKGYRINPVILKQRGINPVTPEQVRADQGAAHIFKLCPKGILCLAKPVFNKDYSAAAVDYSYAYMCIRGPLAMYAFRNGKWTGSNGLQTNTAH